MGLDDSWVVSVNESNPAVYTFEGTNLRDDQIGSSWVAPRSDPVSASQPFGRTGLVVGFVPTGSESVSIVADGVEVPVEFARINEPMPDYPDARVFAAWMGDATGGVLQVSRNDEVIFELHLVRLDMAVGVGSP